MHMEKEGGVYAGKEVHKAQAKTIPGSLVDRCTQGRCILRDSDMECARRQTQP